jgi:hypothetical protein
VRRLNVGERAFANFLARLRRGLDKSMAPENLRGHSLCGAAFAGAGPSIALAIRSDGDASVRPYGAFPDDVAIADIGLITTPLIIRAIIRPDRSRVNTTRSRTTPNIDLSNGWHRNSHGDTCNRGK